MYNVKNIAIGISSDNKISTFDNINVLTVGIASNFYNINDITIRISPCFIYNIINITVSIDINKDNDITFINLLLTRDLSVC